LQIFSENVNAFPAVYYTSEVLKTSEVFGSVLAHLRNPIYILI